MAGKNEMDVVSGINKNKYNQSQKYNKEYCVFSVMYM